jgi:2,4-didehydro-3-deoxy-L-rhamnonate hydrolase
MRIANLSGRLVLLSGTRALDVEAASGGRFSADPQQAYDRWEEFSGWAADIDVETHEKATAYRAGDLRAPVPRPPQVFAIGVNYRAHAAESDIAVPEHPVVFTKYASSLTGPLADIQLSGDTVDWEVELVAVIGKQGRNIDRDRAWEHVAGLTVGQDISDRTVQWQVSPAQFSLGKSFPGFAPLGPAVVSLDELGTNGARDNLDLKTVILDADGASEQVVQDGNTRDLVFSIPELVARLSEVVTLLPGDLIFTGTPEGVGMGRSPQQYLRSGQTLVSSISGLGELRNRMV